MNIKGKSIKNTGMNALKLGQNKLTIFKKWTSFQVVINGINWTVTWSLTLLAIHKAEAVEIHSLECIPASIQIAGLLFPPVLN